MTNKLLNLPVTSLPGERTDCTERTAFWVLGGRLHALLWSKLPIKIHASLKKKLFLWRLLIDHLNTQPTTPVKTQPPQWKRKHPSESATTPLDRFPWGLRGLGTSGQSGPKSLIMHKMHSSNHNESECPMLRKIVRHPLCSLKYAKFSNLKKLIKSKLLR